MVVVADVGGVAEAWALAELAAGPPGPAGRGDRSPAVGSPPPPPPPCVTCPHVASGHCVMSAGAAGALAGVVSALAEPSSWCIGVVLNVAWCAACASAAPNSWRIEDVLVVARGCLTVFAVHAPLSTGRP